MGIHDLGNLLQCSNKQATIKAAEPDHEHQVNIHTVPLSVGH